MQLAFRKMNGAGNDFVLVDGRGGVALTAQQIAHICDRRRGVGADGFIVIEPAPDHDFYMRFYNSDGTEAEMCGNGSRCAAAFGAHLGLGEEQAGECRIRFLTGSGEIDATVAGCRVRLNMMDARAMRLNVPVEVAQVPGEVHFMIVGTRHVVVLMDDAGRLTRGDIMQLGRSLRHHPAFGPEGANVNFASTASDGRIHLRTYEKGVEAETHACGTGSIASAVLYAHTGGPNSPRTVVQRSGDELKVSFELSDSGATGVYLDGPVAVNYDGTLSI